MNWNEYKANLTNNLQDWFNQIDAIQNQTYDDADILFNLNKNTIDAISSMVDVISSGSDFETWIENEKNRQRQKSLQGKIGDLHEIMIVSLKDTIKKRNAEVVEGRDKPQRIFDVYDDSDKWIAEVKGKHNTTKGDDRKSSFDKLEHAITNIKQGYKAYYITILRAGFKKINTPFTPSDNTSDTNKSNPNIIHMDGESFYELITGDKMGLSRAFDTLKDVLTEKYNFDGNLDNLSKIKELSFFKKIVNINLDSQLALEYLPGIGEEAAINIINHRESLGEFSTIEDIKKVNKIGPKTYENIKDYICI